MVVYLRNSPKPATGLDMVGEKAVLLVRHEQAFCILLGFFSLESTNCVGFSSETCGKFLNEMLP